MSPELAQKLIGFDFPYEYKGGGYFREKGKKVGEAGKLLHGEQVVDFIREELKNIITADQHTRSEQSLCFPKDGC